MNPLDKVIVNSIISVPYGVVWLVFGIILIIVAISTMILKHHWKMYGANSPRIRNTNLLYSIGMTILLTVALVAGLVFSMSQTNL